MGLPISVYRDAHLDCDCSNNGVSARFTRLCVVNAEGPFEPREDMPPVLLESHVPGIVRLVPAYKDGAVWKPIPSWVMFGGNFGHTSDSRFGEKARELIAAGCRAKGFKLGTRVDFYGAVAIHDRVE